MTSSASVHFSSRNNVSHRLSSASSFVAWVPITARKQSIALVVLPRTRNSCPTALYSSGVPLCEPPKANPKANPPQCMCVRERGRARVRETSHPGREALGHHWVGVWGVFCGCCDRDRPPSPGTPHARTPLPPRTRTRTRTPPPPPPHTTPHHNTHHHHPQRRNTRPGVSDMRHSDAACGHAELSVLGGIGNAATVTG